MFYGTNSEKNWEKSEYYRQDKDFQEENSNPDLQKKNYNHMTLAAGMW